MSTMTIRWVDPFTGDMGMRLWDIPAFSGAGVAQAMGEIDELEAGLRPGEGAGYDVLAFVEEQGTGGAAFVLQTRGLPHGGQLLVAGRVDR